MEKLIKQTRLIRTLSNHHWEAALHEMIKHNKIYQWAGDVKSSDNSGWIYELEKDNDNIFMITKFKEKNGEIKEINRSEISCIDLKIS